MLPCDICGKTGHTWFSCPDRSKYPADWKPERLQRHSNPAAVDVAAPDGKIEHIPLPSGSHMQMLADLENGRETIAKSFQIPNMLLGTSMPDALYAGFRKAGKMDAAIKAAFDQLESHGGDRKPLVVTQEQFERFKAAGYPESQMVVPGKIPEAPKRGKGRPKSIDDMKAYKAQKARERRARLKAEKESK